MPDIEDIPVEKPPIAVTPTAWQGVTIALVLAMCTAYGVASNLLIYASTRDIAGLIVYLRGSDFLQGISAISVIVGIGGLIYRSLRRKARELFLERNVPPSVAYLKGGSDDPGPAASDDSGWTVRSLFSRSEPAAPLTRARETTTPPVPTRLVNGSVLLHAGGRLPIAPVEPVAEIHYDAGTPIANLAPAQPAAADDGLPSIDMDAFDLNYTAWMVEGAQGSFGDFLIARGWTDTGGKWSPPTMPPADGDGQ